MYSFDARVRYSECDEQSRLTLVSLVNYLQDCSTFHTESLGLGIPFMREHGFAWLIAAWQIEIRRIPRFYDDIQVSTWCYSMTHTMARRNFAIGAVGGGEPWVLADSIWFTFDTKVQRPCRIPESERAYLTDDQPLGLPKTLRKLPVEGPAREGAPIAVAEAHLDTNRHVNNAQYVLMACQALDALAEEGAAGSLAAVTPRRILVQYQRQARLGDVVLPLVHEGADGVTVELADAAARDEAPFAVVRLEGSVES